jgi:NADH-quinone oxidoreductase subunit L
MRGSVISVVAMGIGAVNALGASAPEGGEAAQGAAHDAGHHAAGAVLPYVTGATQSAPPWLLLIPLLPLLAFGLCGLCAAFKVKNKLPAWLTILSLAIAFGLTLTAYHRFFHGHDGAAPLAVTGFEWLTFAWGEGAGQSLTANFGLYVDSLAILWMLFVTGLGALIALYASEYMGHDVGLGYCRFFAAFALFVFSMSCLVMADNLVLLFLGWEGVGLCSYLLIGYFYKKPEAVAAAKKAFIMNRIGDLGLLMAIFSIFSAFGTVEYSKLFAMIASGVDAAGNPIATSTWLSVITPLLLTAGAFGKSAQLFFYVWLPDAMEGPTPVSALIHAATMVTAGVFLIARMLPLYASDPERTILTFVAWGGAITAFWAATIGMAYYDIKRVMGYSTVSQLGFMFAGLGLMTSTGSVFHVFTHAFFKATLFLCCGAVMHGFAGQLDLRKLSGVMKMKGWAIVGIAMLIGSLNLAGFPFTAGFFSKDMILAQAFSNTDEAHIAGSSLIGWLLLLTAGMTAYYTFRVFFRVFVGPVKYEMGEESHSHDDHAHGHAHGHGHAEAPAGHGAHGHAPEGHATSDPHAPGWAINLALVICATLSVLAAGVYFAGPHGGWVAGMVGGSTASIESPHGGTLFGQDPHKLMYYVSGAIGALGIVLAAMFHWFGRTDSATAPADKLFGVVPGLKTLHTWANNKWYVDEIYAALIVRPLYVLSHVFHLIDQYLVDGLVNLLGATPRQAGRTIRPIQSGELHGYAIGMAGGIAVLLVLVFLLTR